MTDPAKSASQISCVRECPRRLWFKYVGKLDEPESPGSSKTLSLAKGKELHAALEAWLGFGAKFDTTSEMVLRARPGLVFLPAVGTPGMQLEYEVELNLMGHAFKQYLDMWVPDASAMPHLDWLLPPYTPCVLDHKSTKNPKKKWEGKKPGLSTREDFLSDPQFLLYSVSALRLEPRASHVMGRWIYYATEGSPYAEKRDVLASREEIAGGVRDHVLPWAEGITAIRKKTSHLDVPPRITFCHKYRSNSPDPAKRAASPGCGYQSECTDVTDRDRMMAAIE